MIYVYYNDDVFMELAECIHQALGKLKLDSQLLTRIDEKISSLDNLFIILGLNNEIPHLPNKYIAYQLEQTGNQHSWFSRKYLEKLRGAIEIWDYSLKNLQNLKHYQDSEKPETLFPQVRYVPMGFMPCLKKIIPAAEKKYDILFYGSACPRRDKMIRALRAAKFRVYYGEYSLWGEERDRLISESRVVLNLHYYPKPILETARLVYLLANQAFVISEPSLDPILDKDYREYVIFSEYDKIVETCQYWLENQDEREKYANEAYLKFLNRDFAKFIPDNLDKLQTTQLKSNQEEASQEKATTQEKDNQEDPKAKTPQKNERRGQIRPKFRKAEVETTPEGEVLKSGNSNRNLKLDDESQYPRVSLVTPTARRTWALTSIALRNFYSFIYPTNKLEWIIVDSDPTDKVNLPSDPRIKYFEVSDQMPLWEKRNYAVKKATGQIIMHLDDDDYYLPTSVLAKVKLLNGYWDQGIECVGCTELGIYHLLENYSYLATTKYISEASMAYTKDFWQARHFLGADLDWGEGYAFVQGREQEVLDMPYSFNFIALTHGENITGALRSIKAKKRKGQYDNFFNLWDRQTQLFFMELRAKAKKYQTKRKAHKGKSKK